MICELYQTTIAFSMGSIDLDSADINLTKIDFSPSCHAGLKILNETCSNESNT